MHGGLEKDNQRENVGSSQSTGAPGEGLDWCDKH